MDGLRVSVRITSVGLTYWLAFMAFLTSLSSAGVMSDVLTPKGAGFLIAVVGGLQAATAVIVGKAEHISASRSESGERNG